MRNIDVHPRVINVPKDMYELSADDVASFFHCGALGIGMGQKMLEEKIQECIEANYCYKAFNVAICYAKQAVEAIGDKIRILVPISYPTATQTIEQKLFDLDKAVLAGAGETCISLDYFALGTRNFSKIESDVRAIHERFEGEIDIIHILPTMLLTDKDIIDACEAIKNGGGRRLKCNPGYGLGVNFEEVMLIKRIYGDFFDVHPSGGIRKYEDFERYVKNNFTNIHSQKSVDFINEFKIRKAEWEAKRNVQ